MVNKVLLGTESYSMDRMSLFEHLKRNRILTDSMVASSRMVGWTSLMVEAVEARDLCWKIDIEGTVALVSGQGTSGYNEGTVIRGLPYLEGTRARGAVGVIRIQR